MDIKTFKLLIQNNQLSGAYCICTPDYGLSQIYVARIEASLGTKLKRVQSISEIRPASKLLKSTESYLMYTDTFDEAIFNLTQLVIQVCTKLDKRTSFYKKHADRIIEMPTPSKDTVIKFIMQNSELNESQANLLCSYCDCSLAYVKNELIKLRASGLSFEQYCAYIYDKPKDAVFALCRALIHNDKSQAIYWLRHCHLVNEAPMVVLTILSNNCKILLQMLDGSPAVQRSISPYLRSQLQDSFGIRPAGQLTKIIRLCNKLDMDIKKGKIDSAIVLDYVVLKTLNIAR